MSLSAIRVAEKFLPPASGNLRILLVEDDASSMMVASCYLDIFGYTYDAVYSGEEAVRMVRIAPYALILMDVKMKGIDGFEATRCIRSFERKKQRRPVRIIGLTAYALVGDRERCLMAGMDDYIAKPFNYQDLQNKLKDLLTEVQNDRSSIF